MLVLAAMCQPWMAHVAAAQPTLNDIAAEKARLNDPALPSSDRLASIERVLKLRRQMIQSRPNDPERALWLADQASDAFFVLLPHEGLGLAALFGAPPPAQRARAQNAAREMHETASQADLAIGQAIVAVESSPGFQDDSALQQKRRDLAEVQRNRRIPFLRGVGAALHAELNVIETAERERLFKLAAQLLSPLIDALEAAAPSLAIEARLHLGIAQSRLGQFDVAEEHFAAVAKDSTSTPSQVFAARMGGVLNRVQRGGASSGLEALASIERHYPIADSAGADLFFRVLIADQRHRLLIEMATQTAPDQRAAAIVQAFAPYSELLRAASAGSAATVERREVLRSIVFSRLSQAADSAVTELALSINDLPAMAVVAHANHLTNEAATRAQAITMLEGALSSGKFDGESRPEALFVLGRALFAHGQFFFAAQRFMELAATYASHPKAQSAIEAAAALAADLHNKTPSDRELQSLLRQVLHVLLDRYPNLPTIERWRFAAARLALDEERFDEATALLTQITPDAPEWPDAHFMQVAVHRARTASIADVPEQRKQREALPALIDRMRPVIESAARDSADSNRRDALNNYLGLLRVYHAEVLLHTGQPQAALTALADMEDEPKFGPLVRAQALKVRINAHQTLKQPRLALGEMQRLVQTSPAHAGEVLVPMVDSIQQDVESLIEIGRDEQAAELSRTALLPVAQIFEQWIQKQAPSSAQGSGDLHDGLRIADAHRLAGQWTEALSRYERLLTVRGDSAEALLGKAECLFGPGAEPSLGSAMEIYKRLAATGPDNAPKQYWLSQLRMLQILDRVNRNTDQIPPRIERLRQQDREFGGERFRRGFEALRQKYASTS